MYLSVCVCVCECGHQSVSPAQKLTGGPVASMHMLYFYSFGDSAGTAGHTAACMHLQWLNMI